LARASNLALGFDGDMSQDHDLGDLLARLEDGGDPDVKAAAQAAHDALDAIVLANYTHGRRVRDATGMTIYSPVDGTIDPAYLQASGWAAGGWDALLVGGARASGSGPL